ncbi:MAG: response regulator [Acidobacteriota bacterium]|nr:response regulator [Acidobacteriota bacterium]MDE3189681.1 response regulator [Acidobacteriota bacterium]
MRNADEEGAADARAVVLHVEDNASNRKLVALVLSRRPQLRLVEALDGETGLALARELRPALILLDLRLPGISGEEVLDALRSDPATAGARIVIVSAEARPVETARLIDRGADGYLVKPVDVQGLLDLLDTVEAPGG